MSKITFENYGRLAASGLSATERAGRYEVQESAEKLVLADVVAKLGLTAADDVLDIGCGTGLLLVPMSFLVRSVDGVDHPAVIEALLPQVATRPVRLFGGSFLDLQTGRHYSAIVLYGVIQCLAEGDLMPFLSKAVSLLVPGGRLLIGDIPNADRKRRFMSTRAGQAFDEQWRSSSTAQQGSVAKQLHQQDADLVHFSDRSVLDILGHFRNQGFDAYLLPQPPQLPFGHTREDILIKRNEL